MDVLNSKNAKFLLRFFQYKIHAVLDKFPNQLQPTDDKCEQLHHSCKHACHINTLIFFIAAF